MPLTILPSGPKRSSAGVEFLKNIGTGLGEGLNQLAHQKMQGLQKQKQLQGWEAIGVPAEQAEFITSQPEWLQKELIDRIDFSQLNRQQQQPYQQVKQAEPPLQEGPSIPENKPGKQALFGAGKEQRKEVAQKFKETKQFRHDLLESRRAAKNDIKDLSRLEELSQSGKLDTPGYTEFLKRSGLDIPALTNPESEEFQKIQASFLRNAKQYFGGRISNYEVEQFLKTIPSLSQSPEGRSRVIANLKYVARAADERYKAYQEVLAEHGGVPPYDLEEQVENKSDKKLDTIYRQLKKDLEKPVPKGQNKFITAIQAGAGDLLGSIPSAIKGAGKGAIAGYTVGKFGGPVGTATGTALGALGGLTGLI
jgi:hypothetical protein